MKKETHNKKTLLVNLFAGPGTGKSSTMAGVFSELKWRGVNCEMGPEFAKEKVWEGSLEILGNQIYVFGKQLHSVYRLMGKVDVVITDSPLLLSLIYGTKEGKVFEDLVVDVHNRFETYNVFLKRHKKYNPSGRLQTEKEAKLIDKKILELLYRHDIPFATMDSGRESVQKICENVIQKIGNDKLTFC
jgi:hypothetical protein